MEEAKAAYDGLAKQLETENAKSVGLAKREAQDAAALAEKAEIKKRKDAAATALKEK